MRNTGLAINLTQLLVVAVILCILAFIRVTAQTPFTFSHRIVAHSTTDTRFVRPVVRTRFGLIALDPPLYSVDYPIVKGIVPSKRAITAVHRAPDSDAIETNAEWTAIVDIYPKGVTTLESIGRLTLTQSTDDGPVHIEGEVHDLTPGRHAMHIHQFGSLEDECEGAGAHFNPFNAPHGGPFDSMRRRHVGDMYQLTAGTDGVATVNYTDDLMTLNPSSHLRITGLTLVIHQLGDDYGRRQTLPSKVFGSAFGRVACGIVREE